MRLRTLAAGLLAFAAAAIACAVAPSLVVLVAAAFSRSFLAAAGLALLALVPRDDVRR